VGVGPALLLNGERLMRKLLVAIPAFVAAGPAFAGDGGSDIDGLITAIQAVGRLAGKLLALGSIGF